MKTKIRVVSQLYILAVIIGAISLTGAVSLLGPDLGPRLRPLLNAATSVGATRDLLTA